MINEELKARFLAGECTEEELIALRDMLKNSPEEKQELFKEEKLSDELKAQFMPKTQLVLAEQRMQAKIREMKDEQQAEHHAHIICGVGLQRLLWSAYWVDWPGSISSTIRFLICRCRW